MATTTYSWALPTEGGSPGTWDTILNAAFESVDSDLTTVQATADAALPVAGGTMTGELEIASERYATNDAGNLTGAVTIDLANGNVQYGTVTGNVTSFAISNPAASGKMEFLWLELTNGGAFTITWPAAIKWDGDSDPTLQSAGVDVLFLSTRDNGTTYRGVHSYSATS